MKLQTRHFLLHLHVENSHFIRYLVKEGPSIIYQNKKKGKKYLQLAFFRKITNFFYELSSVNSF